MKVQERVSLVTSAIDELRRQIESGSWPIGAKIPPEPVLAEELGVGRATLREAVRALAHAGLLEVRQGQGTFVLATDERSTAMARSLAAADALDVVEVRRALDAVAARLAAQRRTEADVAALEKTLDERAGALLSGDERGFTDADVSFHLTVARASRNKLLMDLYASFELALAGSVRHSCFSPEDPTETHHRTLLDAIRAGDGFAAGQTALDLLAFQEQQLTADLEAENQSTLAHNPTRPTQEQR